LEQKEASRGITRIGDGESDITIHNRALAAEEAIPSTFHRAASNGEQLLETEQILGQLFRQKIVAWGSG
jgi:hypothetical protein